MPSRSPEPERSISEQVGALVDERLLKLLSRVYPDRAPRPGTPVDKVWFDAGTAEVVRYLSDCHRIASRGDNDD